MGDTQSCLSVFPRKWEGVVGRGRCQRARPGQTEGALLAGRKIGGGFKLLPKPLAATKGHRLDRGRTISNTT